MTPREVDQMTAVELAAFERLMARRDKETRAELAKAKRGR